MAIPIEHEDVAELKKWGLGLDKILEVCEFCNQHTRYWHHKTNTPVCEVCASTHKVADIKRPNMEFSGVRRFMAQPPLERRVRAHFSAKENDMGMSKKRSWSTYDKSTPAMPNPDPKNFQVKRYVTVGDGLVVEVHYPDCTNYEGRKVLVYVGVTLGDLLRQGSIDPHFCEGSAYHSPIARFEPTENGWALATHVAGLLRKGNRDDS